MKFSPWVSKLFWSFYFFWFMLGGIGFVFFISFVQELENDMEYLLSIGAISGIFAGGIVAIFTYLILGDKVLHQVTRVPETLS